MRLLIAENDPAAAKLLAQDLAALGHACEIVGDGRAALAQATESRFDAILLECLLPFVDGVAVTALLRDRGIDLPIVMVSVVEDLDQRLIALEAGADDYLVKPAAPAEIDARLRVILRRGASTRKSGVMWAGDIEVNEIKRSATRAGRAIKVQNIEFRILCELVRNVNTVVTRQMLYEAVWNYETPPRTNVVESHMTRLRTHLTQPGERDPIATIRGAGYMLSDKD
ncbi:response regulator transcription factor [Sphingomonas sp. H39-1-10]|uniref:response regulator transcription factor n=1 Tax=Sphingomonas pollutisoli TaxID=3030829 RepID=UPI0023B96391|nr:response regulator transcription factor [Sphingomonas pollutisoli]MDF0489929.1 response regulator transcription factor [Sphingomonas pollutisoli]